MGIEILSLSDPDPLIRLSLGKCMAAPDAGCMRCATIEATHWG